MARICLRLGPARVSRIQPVTQSKMDVNFVFALLLDDENSLSPFSWLSFQLSLRELGFLFHRWKALLPYRNIPREDESWVIDFFTPRLFIYELVEGGSFYPLFSSFFILKYWISRLMEIFIEYFCRLRV